MKQDLHIHSCLSPCGDEEMTPNNIAGMAHLAGLDVIAVCDHNTAENLPAIQLCAKEYGIKLLPGIEVCTQEEIHLLCYFSALEPCLKMSKALYESLPNIKNKPEIYGRQVILNENDEEIGQLDKLLITGCGYTLFETAQLCHSLGGLCFYAHMDKNSYSVLSVLGALPQEVDVEGAELFKAENRKDLVENGLLPADLPCITNSDAHDLAFIGENCGALSENNPLRKFIETL